MNGPIDPAPPFNPFVFLGGVFQRFPDDELRDRYPRRDDYVRLVRRAADELAEGRYIAREDAEAMVRQARVEPLP